MVSKWGHTFKIYSALIILKCYVFISNNLLRGKNLFTASAFRFEKKKKKGLLNTL